MQQKTLYFRTMATFVESQGFLYEIGLPVNLWYLFFTTEAPNPKADCEAQEPLYGCCWNGDEATGWNGKGCIRKYRSVAILTLNNQRRNNLYRPDLSYYCRLHNCLSACTISNSLRVLLR